MTAKQAAAEHDFGEATVTSKGQITVPNDFARRSTSLPETGCGFSGAGRIDPTRSAQATRLVDIARANAFRAGAAGLDLDKTIDEAITAAMIERERRSRARMIGLDTNVLLRLFVEDDPQQNERARRLFDAVSARKTCVVNPVVLAEFAWTLVRGFKKKRREVAHLIAEVLSADDSNFPPRAPQSARLPPIVAAGPIFQTISSPKSTSNWAAPPPRPSIARHSTIPPSPPCRESLSMPPSSNALPPTSLPRAHYAEMFGPTTGDVSASPTPSSSSRSRRTSQLTARR